MSIVVFLEQHEGDVTKASLGVLSKAASLGAGPVGAVVVGGDDVEALAAIAGRFGATAVHVAAGDTLADPVPQPRVDVLAEVVRTAGYDTVLFSNSVLAADVAAGLAARLEAGLNWDLVDLAVTESGTTAKRLALGDSVLVDVGWRTTPRVALFRPGSFDPVESDTGEPRVERVAVDIQPHSTLATMVEHRSQPDEGPSVEDAEVIVSGGMGLGAAENFALAEELASALGGVVGATRAAVYAGWYPYSAQIGQTGKTVSPRLYVALGISGAIQHKVGMQSSKTIVAINKDPSAPIFEFSDLAVVGDVHQIVPKLTELVRQRKGS
jgi:electron transfer flavoprotein alpha subunit